VQRLTTGDGHERIDRQGHGHRPRDRFAQPAGLTRRARELLWLESLQHGVIACLVVRVQVDAGDTTMIAEHCAATLRAAVRLSDVIARLAPTDFAVIAPDTDARGSRKLAARLSEGDRRRPSASRWPRACDDPAGRLEVSSLAARTAVRWRAPASAARRNGDAGARFEIHRRSADVMRRVARHGQLGTRGSPDGSRGELGEPRASVSAR